ncbi:MAG TPA: hypothetical protein VN999_00485, partial [Thermoanaerobaculia bacterium]|nr:hypothetical protein [Thermoanaerobaculia bacterium]
MSSDLRLRLRLRPLGGSRGLRRAVPACLLLLLAALAGCRHDMQNQNKMRPYRESTFYPDGAVAGRAEDVVALLAAQQHVARHRERD